MLCWECLDIAPDRRWSQGAVFHARRQDATGVRFPLHEQQALSVWKHASDSEVEGADA
jgi:hypothetical protein